MAAFAFLAAATACCICGLEVSVGGTQPKRSLKVSGRDERPSVSLTLRSTGSRKAAEIVQVHVGTLPGRESTPQRQLAGYARVNLAARKTKQVTIKLDPRVLQVWSESRNRWVTPSGKVRVYVGSSSTDLPLEGTIRIG